MYTHHNGTHACMCMCMCIRLHVIMSVCVYVCQSRREHRLPASQGRGAADLHADHFQGEPRFVPPGSCLLPVCPSMQALGHVNCMTTHFLDCERQRIYTYTHTCRLMRCRKPFHGCGRNASAARDRYTKRCVCASVRLCLYTLHGVCVCT